MSNDGHVARDGGCFGAWREDEHGLPAFAVADDLATRSDLVLPDGDPRRVWHQVGNDRISATAHAGGWLTLYSAEAGLVRLSSVDPSRPNELGGTWRVADDDGADIVRFDHPALDVTWGVGQATWMGNCDGIRVHRTVWAPFGDLPVLRIDVSLHADSGLPAGRFCEQWGFSPYPVVLVSLMSRSLPPPESHPARLRLLWRLMFAATHLSRELVEAGRRLLATRLALVPEVDPDTGAVLLSVGGRAPGMPTRPSALAAIPGVVFVAPLNSINVTPIIERAGRRTTVGLHATLPAGERETHLSFVVGLASQEEVRKVIARAATAERSTSAAAWRRPWQLDVGDATLRRESQWHAAMLRSSQLHSAVLGSSYVPQGSAYGFLHGIEGVPRDYAISAVGLAHVHPEGAKDLLRTMLRMMDPDGNVLYGHTGAGFVTSAGFHTDPSDLPIALLWTITEVVWATGDTALLDEPIGFRPRRRGTAEATTVRERALLLWRRLRDHVGLGPHGLVRVCSGDWNDPISAMAPDRRAFRRHGESTYNSAFACYVLPRAAMLLRPTHPKVADEIDAFVDRLRAAVAQMWQGRWFLRGHDGRTGLPSSATAIGADHLFLDANAWCLIAQVGDDGMRRTLVEEIATRSDEPSPIGALALDRPHKVRGGILPDGWDTNGGIWAALNAFLTWGYALHDPDLAWRSLHKQGFAAHASAYPRVWYGIWSGPDAYNAHYAEQPGETFVQPATPMQEFPVMNSNAEAGPLLATLKVFGIEAGPGGFNVTPHVPDSVGPWRLRTMLIDVKGRGSECEVWKRPLR